MGARCSRGERFSMAAAEASAAKAAKAKVVNCILEVLVGWFGGKLVWIVGLGVVDRWIGWKDVS
jgi:hypothetical protein